MYIYDKSYNINNMKVLKLPTVNPYYYQMVLIVSNEQNELVDSPRIFNNNLI